MRLAKTLLLLAAVSAPSALLLPALAAEPAPPAYVTAADTQYEIDNLREEATVRLAVTLKDGLTAVDPRLADVALGTWHDQSLAQAFTVEFENVAKGSRLVPTIIIKVKTAKLEQGTYKLRIEVRPAAALALPAGTPPQGRAVRPAAKALAAKEPRPQYLEVALSLPAAQLRQPGPLVIEQVWPLFGSAGGGHPDELTLTESSGKKTRLTDITISQIDKVEGENGGVDEKVEFTPVMRIDPRETGRSAITLSGTFPLGTNKGTAQIVSPQLSAPTTFSFEVRARRSPATIVAAILAGLLAGFVTRIWATRRIERSEARLKAIEVAKVLEDELARRPDAAFHAQLDPPLANLRTAIESADVAAINGRATEAKSALTTALEDLGARRTAARGDLQTLHKLAGSTARLPPEVAAAFTVETKVLVEAGHLIGLDDIAGARRVIAGAASRLGREVGPAISSWRVNSKSFLAQVAALVAALPSSMAVGVSGEVEAVVEKLDELTPPDEDTDVAGIASASDSVRDARVKSGEFLLGMKSRLGISAQTLLEEFGQLTQPVPLSIREVTAKLGRIQQNLLTSADSPGTGAQELSAALIDLKNSWRGALLAQIKGDDAAANEAAKTSVQTLLDEEKYLDASLKVVQFLRDNPPKTDILLGGGADAAAVMITSPGVVDESLTALVTDGPAPGQLTFDGADGAGPAPTLDLLEASTLRELVLAKGLRFGVASILTVIIGTVLFADRFVGTLPDLLAVFVWAYGVNISVDAVMEAGKELKLNKEVS